VPIYCWWSGLVAIAGVLALLGAPARAGEPAPPARVSYHEGRLSVTAEAARLADVLQEVARVTGVDIEGHERLADRLSIALANLPLRDGLRRLLAVVSYVWLEEPGAGRGPGPTRILVLGPAAPADPMSTIVPSSVPVPGPAPAGPVMPAPPRIAETDAPELLRSPYGEVLFSDETTDDTAAKEDTAP
jgi:hypothetical protein